MSEEESAFGESELFNNKICVIGAGYVGATISAVIAAKCKYIKVIVVDKDIHLIKEWNDGGIPIREPSLDNLIAKALSKNLFFSADIDKAILESDIIILAVNTPSKKFGPSAKYDLDISSIESAVRNIAKVTKDANDTHQKKIIIEKSTVPCGTASRLRDILRLESPDLEFEILSNPEFMAEGTAINDILYPARVLIGSENTESGLAAAKILSTIYENWVPEEDIITIDLWSSELAKVASNAMLAQRISSINSLATICEHVGANIKNLKKVIGSDERIGSKYLTPSVGFGGSCLRKDVASLVYLARSFQLFEVADYWEQVLSINSYQKWRCAQKVISALNGNVNRKNICILGFAFKKNTGDIRETPAADIAAALIKEGANIKIYDQYAEWKNMVKEIHICLDIIIQETNNPHCYLRYNKYDNQIIHITPPPPDCSTLALGTNYSYNIASLIQSDIIYVYNDSSLKTESVNIKTDFEFSKSETPLFEISNNEYIYDHLKGSSAIIITLSYAKFKYLNYERIYESMQKPAIIFDGCNILDVDKMKKIGFVYLSI